jgi:PAS domain S-box-containing protein
LSQSALVFLGLTAIVAALAGVLAFAVLRIFAAARAATKKERAAGAETAFMAAAMEDAVRKLRDGERAMKARAEASERLASEIVASLTSGLLVVDGQGIIRTLNPAGQAMLGLTGKRWDGRYRDVLKDAGPLADVLDECLTTSTPVVRRAVPIDIGRVSHLGLTVSPIREAAGDHAHGVICLFSDLTEVMELEEQLRLKDSLARLGEMTAGIAHEFRNGLATIHGYSRLLDLDKLEPKYRPYVEGIREETEDLKQVVTNFLNFAKPTELTLTPVDMSALADRAADEVRADARVRGGDVVVRGRPLLPSHGLRRFQAEAADEDGEPAEEALLRSAEQVVAPGDGAAQGALARGEVARADAQGLQPLVEQPDEGLRGESGHPRRGELDGERQAVEAATDLGDGGGIVLSQGKCRIDSAGALHEEGDGVGLGQDGQCGGVLLREIERRDGQQALDADA